MNAFTKVLVVLVLLLSVGFAASQIVLYGKRQDLSAMLDKATSDLKAASTLAADRAAQLKDLQDKTDRTISDLRVQAQDLQTRLSDKTLEAAGLQSQFTTEQASVKSLTEATKSQLASIDSLNANLRERDAKIADQGAQLTAKITQIADLTETVKQANAKIGEQEQQITAVKKENKKLADANDDMMAQLQDLVRRGVEVAPTYGRPSPPRSSTLTPSSTPPSLTRARSPA